MSAKKAKKYGNVSVPATSLSPGDKDGYLTKQGGSIKTWKRRYCILKGKNLYYYKTPKDSVFTGRVDLEPNSKVAEDPKPKKPGMFAVHTSKRVFYMYPDKPEEMNDWITAINKGIEYAKQNPSSPPAAPVDNNNSSSAFNQDTKPSDSQRPATTVPAGNSSDLSPRDRLTIAKGVVPFLKDEESKVLEFWEIWSQSIPAKEDLPSGLAIEFYVATSADMQKLTWRTSGPQNIFIQKMVDFFWNVGAPESEIDRLNDVGALINPIKIGSWIDMSAKGGMDGGWFFPVDIPIKLAIESADAGDAIRKFGEWAEAHGVMNSYAVGRDMGAAPPRQTEIRMKLPGSAFDEQLNLAFDAFTSFGFPAVPDNAARALKNARTVDASSNPVCLSVITSSEGFVRLGILVPRPSTETVLELCGIAGGNRDALAAFEGSFIASFSGPAGTSTGPLFVEFQYLMKGFGYGVYKEGFDVVFHYNVGIEDKE